MKNIIASAVAATLLLAGAASADILRGEVYQVTGSDVYVEMADHTVARVPVETASFYLADGDPVLWSELRTGQDVVVDYTPIYGFQQYYYESSDLAEPDVTYFLLDADPAVVDFIEHNGRIYRILR